MGIGVYFCVSLNTCSNKKQQGSLLDMTPRTELNKQTPAAGCNYTSEEYRKAFFERGLHKPKGNKYEGTSFGQENVRQMQDRPAQGQGPRYLREPTP